MSRAIFPFLFVALALAAGCESKRHGTGGAGVQSRFTAPQTKPSSNPLPESQTEPPPAQEDAAETDAASEPPLNPAATLTQRWKLSAQFDVGPAAPMTAASDGVYLVTRRDELLFARLNAENEFTPVTDPKEAFAKYGRGPALSKTHAYWVSRSGQLMRGDKKTGKTEVLTEKAHPGARVTVVHAADRDVVSFLSEQHADPSAYIWAEGLSGRKSDEIVRLSPEGSAASSIALVEEAPHPRAIVLEGRTGMSPVHSRRVRITRRRVTLEPDEVVWVGPGSHPLTELTSLGHEGQSTTALLATARDITHFGLAQLDLSAPPGAPIAPKWRLYPNGLDPAPVAAASLCGKDYALFVVPITDKPHSPQQLRAAQLSGGALSEEEDVLAVSGAFNDISVAPKKGGAVITWTADRRTWAMAVGCP